MSDTVLATFFSFAFEQFLNEKLFFRDFELDENRMNEYTDDLISIPVSAYLDYMVGNILPCYVLPQDIVQYSSLQDATSRFCQKLLDAGDEGLRYQQIGALLLDDGKARKRGALLKYGENHAKTAIELGLAQNVCDYIYLSCMGVVFNTYTSEKQRKLLKRLAFRNRFIQRLAILSQKGVVSLSDEMSILSESTIKRRRSNIRTLFCLFDDEELCLFSNILGLDLFVLGYNPSDLAAE